jgi:CO/xanthine dehydrogenase FAD-binding subunit
VKPARFDYLRVESVEEAQAILAEVGDEAKLLAGGQSLVPMLNMRLASPRVVVDVNRVPGLDGVLEENGSVRVGALVRQSALEAASVTRNRLPLVAEALPYVGHFVTRNRGTVGGSIAHADAKAELPLALVTLGGEVVVFDGGERRYAAEDFFVTHFTTRLDERSVLVETVWPAAESGSGFAFEELAYRAGDYAVAMAACAMRLEGGHVAEARVGIGAVGERPLLSRAGPELAGRAVDEELVRGAGETARSEVEPVGSLHASSEYQRHLTGLLVERVVRRAWRNALEGAGA